MTEKRFWCLDEYKGETSPIVDGKFAPTNEWLCNKLNELHEENEQLKQELFESEKECIMIDYRDNPIRRNDKIIDLKEEYKERFGRDFE